MPPRQAPTWLDAAVYEPKRQRTFEIVKRAVDTLVEQRKQDEVTRISLTTIVATAKQQDPSGQGIAHTSILENEEAYAYYKKFRTARPLKHHQPASRNGDTAPVIKADRDQGRVRQRYMKWNRTDLIDHLLSVEQQYAELHGRYLATNDTLLEWQLRAEAAETQLNTRQEHRSRETNPPLPAKSSLPKYTPTEKQATPGASHEQLAMLQDENAVLRTTIQVLFDFHEKLRDVKEMARTDTQARPFRAWLKQARAYAETPFGQRFLEKSMGMSPRASRGRYQEEMRRAGFPQEERELFQEAWEAMLWQELFRVEYVTIRDTIEHALATLFSVGVY